jgi:hypothetical protein
VELADRIARDAAGEGTEVILQRHFVVSDSRRVMRVSSLLRWMRTPRCAVSRLMFGCAPRSVSGHKRTGGAW